MEELVISTEKPLRINNQITVRQVRLIGSEGEQLGVVRIEQAMETAQEAGMDLVEISPTGQPPVCRIMDFGKHQFQLNKKKAAAKKKQKQVQIKEMKYRPVIEEGDYLVKLRKISEFLVEGDKVKIAIRFRGREISHNDLGFKLAERLQTDLVEIAIVEQSPKFEGKQVIMVFGPKKK